MAPSAPVRFFESSSADSLDYSYNSNPVAAITSYSMLMHKHTKQQMDAAKSASRRRSGDATVDAQASLSKQGSIDSTTTGVSREPL
jgi:hypothetical protein